MEGKIKLCVTVHSEPVSILGAVFWFLLCTCITYTDDVAELLLYISFLPSFSLVLDHEDFSRLLRMLKTPF